MSSERRISDFWLSGGVLTHPEPEPTPPPPHPNKGRPVVRYFYGVEHGDDGPVVHRFRYRADLAMWVAVADPWTREVVLASHELVERAKARDEWGQPDEDEHDDAG